MDSSPKHRRNISKSSRPRAPTKGPLDAPDEHIALKGRNDQRALQPELTASSAFADLDPLISDQLRLDIGKDLSYLLRDDLYHPLSQIQIPPALRFGFVTLSPDDSLMSSIGTLEKLLAEGHFLHAAHLSAAILASPLVSPTDVKVIFALFYTRLACLELSGNTILAAQESKALEDLSSAFYYVSSDLNATDLKAGDGKTGALPYYPRHIAPWPLRVLGVRLQGIGFGDSRRGISGLYELGLEARREITRPGINQIELRIWKERLEDLGIRSVNALIEMGDFDAARRALNGLRTSDTDSTYNIRKALLLLHIGDTDGAKLIVNESSEANVFTPLLSMSEGRYADAAGEWRALLEKSDSILAAQNLAVCLLYTGKLNEARELLESMAAANNSFPGLLFNLSTIYELCSEQSNQLKMRLVETIAKQPASGQTNFNRSSADFKL